MSAIISMFDVFGHPVFHFSY